MGFHYVVAVVRPEVVAALEARLSSLGIGGVTLTKVRGFGEYKNFYSRDWLTEQLKVEVFVEAPMLDALLGALREIANADGPGAGVVAMMSLDKFLHLRTGADVLPGPTP